MIITNNEAALRVFCEPVLPSEVGSLIETLEKELDYANKIGRGGIGLAAPQIGIAKDIAIVRLSKISINLVNARLKQGFDPAVFQEEGCLSFPGRVEDTTRFQEVYIANNIMADSLEILPYWFIATGLVAVVCQHELDHLSSILFTDRKIVKPITIIKPIKVGPNDPCSCGSGKKYKKCCAK